MLRARPQHVIEVRRLNAACRELIAVLGLKASEVAVDEVRRSVLSLGWAEVVPEVHVPTVHVPSVRREEQRT